MRRAAGVGLAVNARVAIGAGHTMQSSACRCVAEICFNDQGVLTSEPGQFKTARMVGRGDVEVCPVQHCPPDSDSVQVGESCSPGPLATESDLGNGGKRVL